MIDVPQTEIEPGWFRALRDVRAEAPIGARIAVVSEAAH